MEAGEATKTVSTPPADNITQQKNAAEAAYNNWKNQSRPQYTAGNKKEIAELLRELEEREFSYDVTNDEVYKRYRDSVKTSAELALADAVGLASALNGGYATSYAELSGQAAYYNTMKAADEIIPQLYRDAYDRYSDETDDMYTRLDALMDMDEEEWERYLDMLEEYNSEGERLFDRYTDLSNEEFELIYNALN